jgi:23S rRNA-/tRNA-specific pseudouridylate synthase
LIVWLNPYSLGHTIVGDYTYSDKTDIKPTRMYLHAFKMELPNKVESLYINAGDPFENIPEYVPQEEIHDLTNITSLFDSKNFDDKAT